MYLCRDRVERFQACIVATLGRVVQIKKVAALAADPGVELGEPSGMSVTRRAELGAADEILGVWERALG
jgi:hypothetical protein